MDFIYGILTGIGISYYSYQWYRKKKLPYNWSCLVEGCAFSIDTNDLDTVDTMASGHERIHAERE